MRSVGRARVADRIPGPGTGGCREAAPDRVPGHAVPTSREWAAVRIRAAGSAVAAV
ncbi:hypothetical protein [Plantactinospora sonchi]|uniref:Uncharacterized protein n=1 Tax=Plantactinospora sonchi TaxID=1544735 RepID=A0ABU7RVI5_9ACTN